MAESDGEREIAARTTSAMNFGSGRVAGAVLATLVWVLAAAPLAASTDDAAPLTATVAPITDAQTTMLDTAGTNALALLSAPGISVAIARDGTIAYARGFGLRDVAHGEPVDAKTVFALGPITKQFTAAAIEMLALSQKISLDAPLSTYVPQAPHASEIRVRDLLHETSGLPDYLTQTTLATIAPSTTISPTEILATIASKPLEFPPGSKCATSGSNYVALGALVEAVTGKSYADFVRDRIAVPLGLSTLRFGPPADAEDLARGYDLADYGRRIDVWTAQSMGAAGGLYASAADVAKWDAAFFGGKVVPKATVDAMMMPATLADGTTSDCASGTLVDTTDGVAAFSQHGGMPGSSVLNTWMPATSTAIAVFGNSIAFDPREFQRASVLALATAVSEPAHEDPSATARARAEYRAWEYGTVDPTRYGSDMQRLIASPAAIDVTATLHAAGDPTAFVFEGTATVAGTNVHRYRAQTARATFEMNIGYARDGSIAKIAFSRTN